MDPICAPATPLLPSAVAVVRVSGVNLVERFQGWVRLGAPRQAVLRWLRWEGFQERALVLYFPAPHSATGEDVVEFHLHGNPLLVRRFLEHLGRLGIRLAEPGEFARRALLNGKVSLLDVEALRDLVTAATDTQLRQAQAMAGGIPAWILEARRRLAPWVARAEAAVDYGEEEGLSLDLPALQTDLGRLREVFHVEHLRSEGARWLRDGLRVVLVGRPNAGKSTLFNALAGEDRAIVTDHPGTTRDVLEVRVDFVGLPLRIFDTAGLRRTEDPVERIGMERVVPVLGEADCILHLVPATDDGPDPAVTEILRPFEGRVLVVRTFADRGRVPEGEVGISARTGALEPLARALCERFLGGQAPEACLGALATARQRALLQDLLTQVDWLLGLPPDVPPELPASLLQGLWGLLARLTGEDRAESTLDALFSGFCLGK